MRRLIHLLILTVLGISAGSAQAQVLAFPEAEGFGRFTTGARTNLAAANVYHVTNLNDSGAGSFRDAVSQSNRFVVFDIGGILNINSVVTVASNITIAGQTAPGGITLYNNRISFTNSHNLISRHFAVRKGTASGREDTASIARGQNMIFDHMSITWGVDANFDINPDSGFVIDNITIQNSIIGQGLDNVGHSTGGLVQPGDGGSTSIIKSLYIDNVTRNPKVRAENEFINNVVYGWETAGYIMGDTAGSSFANVEGNYFIEGPVDGGGPFNSGTPTFNIYANDNWVDTDRDGVLDGSLVTSYPGSTVVATRHAFPTNASMTAQQAVTHVMANAGPSIIRDAVDSRMMQEVASYGLVGGVIQRETDLFPGYGTNPSYLNPRARFTDVDNDGMADNWESAHGLNPANAADWKGLNGAGYTRLEEYVNELGAAGTTVNSTGGVWTAPGTWTSSTPTLADAAVATGNLSVASGQAFARRLSVDGSLAITGGTLDVFDTATLNGAHTISGGVLTAGRVQLGSFGQSGTLAITLGGTLQSGPVVTSGTASLDVNGGTFRATGAPDIRVPTTLGATGGVFDTGAYSGQMTGGISGAGGFTKQGAGTLTITGTKSYTGPTVIQGGQVVVQGGNVNQTSGVSLGSGTTLNVSAVGGLNLGAGKSLIGTGTVVGNVVASTGAVVNPQGGQVQPLAQVVAVQAESMNLGSDWAIFDNAQHGTGAGGSYNGADLNGGGIVMLSNAGAGAAPVATGVASATIEVPATKTYYLFARTAEPTLSPIPGDPATQPGGNNSFWTSAQASSVQATTSNFDTVQTFASPGNVAVWNLLSTSISPLAGVASPIDAGITYSLTSGTKQFAVYGRESGTIIDGFVLSDTNLTVAQLNQALSTGNLNEELVLTVTGNYQQSTGATFAVELAGGTALNKLNVTGSAQLGGDLSVSLSSGFSPQSSDVFSILDASNLVGQFDNAAAGARVPIAGGAGSFEVNYDYAGDRVTLSNFLAGIAGDFDGDGDVDGRDFLAWQRNPSVGNLSDWQTNYGVSALMAASTAIPEPGTMLLTSLAVLTYLSRR
jgi:autotransporter-associated beta strand protein